MAPRNSPPGREKGSILPTSFVHGAGKWVTAGITTIAALLALLVNAQNLGLGAWLGSHGIGFADYAASRIAVTPRSDSLFAVGDTVMLAATVTDRRGASLVGARIIWRSDDSSVVSVDSAGTVVARGPGAARVTAAVRELVAGSRIVVRQRVVRVAISGDSLIRIPEGDHVPVAASALDARGYRVRDLSPRWTSADGSIASVDSAGNVTARAPGRTALIASVEDYGARAVVEVVLAPAGVVLEAGDAQRIPAGRKLPQSVVVRVVSRSGRPVPSVVVTFRPEDTDGAVEPATVITDRAGRARTSWTLSARPGRQRLAASVDGLDSSLAVAVEADPLPKNTKLQLSGNPLAGVVGQALSAPVTVRVTDSLGAALADLPVAWTALDGERIESLIDRTDSLGEARAQWTLGPKAGAQRARLQVGNPRSIPPFLVTAAAAAGPPHLIRVAAGGDQRGLVGRPLAKAASVLVTDVYGNPVAGAGVSARPRDGSLPDSTATTDSTGHAAFRWTLGHRAGPQRMELRTVGLDSVATVGARADPLSPANVTFQNPPATGTGGRSVSLAVLVSDEYGNPVPGARVMFSVTAGTISAVRVVSDEHGRVQTRWTLAGTAPAPSVTAAVRGTALKSSHTVHLATTPAQPHR